RSRRREPIDEKPRLFGVTGPRTIRPSLSTTLTPRPPLSTATLASPRSLAHACLAASICHALRGKDTIVLDLTGITPLFDYFVICTGNSRRQMHAIATEVQHALKRDGSKRLRLEGFESSRWIVQDFGDVVVHVFTEEA